MGVVVVIDLCGGGWRCRLLQLCHHNVLMYLADDVLCGLIPPICQHSWTFMDIHGHMLIDDIVEYN